LNSTHRAALASGATAFCLVAILNSGGYRYGIGDQAFYVPAVIQHLNPDLFPRDRVLLHAQDRFMLYDDATALVAGWTGVGVPVLFVAGYLTGMGLLFAAVVAIGTTLYRSWWTVAFLAGVMTLRHRITQTGANSLEAYFQPRMVAFALGAWALARYLQGKALHAWALVVIAFALHPTTALWFALWIGSAMLVTEARWRRHLLAIGTAAIVAGVWAVASGPLQGHLDRMDPAWASSMAGKDYIFPADWNASFWIVNLAYLPVAALVYRTRLRRGVALPREIGLLAGAGALLATFLLAWPLMAAGVALALQLQPSRIFWMLDFLAAIYLSWLLSEAVQSQRLRQLTVAVIVTAAVARGLFVWRAERGGGPLVRVNLPQDSWTDAMRWLSRSTPPDAHVLADPGHAWKYGSSVRVAAERDVYLEEVKDLALALYSRPIAMEAIRRIGDASGFDAFTAEQFRTLGARYDLDFLVLDRDADLPLAYRNDGFRVYSLQPLTTHK
jgi:hypothetical protein